MGISKGEELCMDSSESEEYCQRRPMSFYSHGFVGCDSLVSQLPIQVGFLETVSPYTFSCLHPNIAVTYCVTVAASGPVLVVEKVETSLTNLISEVGGRLTFRERVDLAFGIMSAVDYLHHHVTVSHGLFNSDVVFFTSDMTAKILDPVAALLTTSSITRPYHTVGQDVKDLKCILSTLFNETSLDFSPVPGHLQAAIDKLVDVNETSLIQDTSQFLDVLCGLRQTTEYCSCPPRRKLMRELLHV